MAKVTIYHNPRCTKSRQTLALLRDQDIEPQIVEYLKTPPSESTLKALVDQLGIEPVDLIREREYRELGLAETDNPEEIIRRMVAYPQILQRPIVVSGNQARIGRPPEKVLEIL